MKIERKHCLDFFNDFFGISGPWCSEPVSVKIDLPRDRWETRKIHKVDPQIRTGTQVEPALSHRYKI